MSLWERIKNEYENNSEFWNYYGSYLVNPFDDERDAKYFIYNYFYNGCKECVLNEWKDFDEMEKRYRDIHVVYVFFIGVMLQHIIDPLLKIESEFDKQGEGYTFAYLWYLVCLAHDLGYVYESENVEQIINRVKPHINSSVLRMMVYKKYLGKKHKLSQSISLCKYNCIDKKNANLCREMCRGQIKYNNGTIINRNMYSRKLKDNYFRYRLLHWGKIDHGIIGADKFFSDMYYNYFDNYEKRIEGDLTSFINIHNRYFSCEHFKIFAYVADCIAAHNVFRGSKDNDKLYEEYELNKISFDNFELISYEKNPLLFILCLADTLEPTKRFRNTNPRKVLENIDISYNKKEKRISLKVSETFFEGEEVKEYIKNVKNLQDWCDVSVEEY